MTPGMDPVAYGKELGGLIREALQPLKDRIAALEGSRVSKSLDAAAYDEMADMAERLERMEAGLAEQVNNSLRYRGYYRDGMRAKRGDAYTHDGSLWWAARDTDDKPCNESPDWQIAVRKGRDAK